jgi:hypothetical protein
LKATLWHAADGSMPLRRVRLIATRLCLPRAMSIKSRKAYLYSMLWMQGNEYLVINSKLH